MDLVTIVAFLCVSLVIYITIMLIYEVILISKLKRYQRVCKPKPQNKKLSHIQEINEKIEVNEQNYMRDEASLGTIKTINSEEGIPVEDLQKQKTKEESDDKKESKADKSESNSQSSEKQVDNKNKPIVISRIDETDSDKNQLSSDSNLSKDVISKESSVNTHTSNGTVPAPIPMPNPEEKTDSTPKVEPYEDEFLKLEQI